MKTILFLTLMLMIGCGRNTLHTTYLAQEFEGYYYCDDNSNVELIADYQNRVTFETGGQSLNSVNPVSGDLGTHPTVGERDLLINGTKLVIFPRNYNYSSTTHDIENDVTGSNVTGNHRTDILVEKVNSSKIKIRFTVFAGAVNSNINSIIALRELNCSL